MELYDHIGNKEWYQICLTRRVSKGYSQCLFCQQKMTKETIDYYKVGFAGGYASAQVEMLTLGTNKADDIETQRSLKVPEESKRDYYLGFQDGKNEYEDDYSMNATFGFDL